MSDRESLLTRAQELGIEFQKNTPTIVLEQRIAVAEEAENPGFVGEEIEESETDSEEVPEPVVETKPQPSKVVKVKKGKPQKEETPAQRRKRRNRELKEAAHKTRVVTLTNRDNRDNNVTTTAYLAVENQFWSLARIVPLDIAVELEQCLIDNAKSSMITLHKDEIVNGRRTGNSRPVSVPKYTVSYAEQQPNS